MIDQSLFVCQAILTIFAIFGFFSDVSDVVSCGCFHQRGPNQKFSALILSHVPPYISFFDSGSCTYHVKLPQRMCLRCRHMSLILRKRNVETCVRHENLSKKFHMCCSTVHVPYKSIALSFSHYLFFVTLLLKELLNFLKDWPNQRHLTPLYYLYLNSSHHQHAVQHDPRLQLRDTHWL